MNENTVNGTKFFISLILMILGLTTFIVAISIMAFKLHYLLGIVFIATIMYIAGYKLMKL